MSSEKVASAEHTVTVSREQIGKRAGRLNRRVFLSASQADIEQMARDDDEPTQAELGPVRVVVPGPDIRQLRDRLGGISQELFAERFRLSLRTVQEWEQRRRSPDGPARLLLQLIAAGPELVARVLGSEDDRHRLEPMPLPSPSRSIRTDEV